MSFEVEEEEAFEHTLLEVSVYKIPPRSTSDGYKCGEWLQNRCEVHLEPRRVRVVSRRNRFEVHLEPRRVRVVSRRNRCSVHLEDPNSGELFAACFLYPSQRAILF